MAYIVYCITAPQNNLAVLSRGMDGMPVSLISESSLTAVASVLPKRDRLTAFDLSAYAKVVEDFFQQWTVIPMRFGCFFDEESDLRQFLSERKKEFQILLSQLDGMVEMGIRIILSRADCNSSPQVQSCPSASGHDYLATRRAYYASVETEARKLKETGDRVRVALSEWSADNREETRMVEAGHMLSLYFLVRRSSVGAFQQKFSQIRATLGGEALANGPWPPYNFVESVRTEEEGISSDANVWL